MPSEETKERIIKAVELGRAVVHYGWIPFIIYIGYTRSNPQPSLINCVIVLRSVAVQFLHGDVSALINSWTT